MSSEAQRVAVLIDCDNISHQLCEAIFEEASAHGTLGIKRAYGDWTSPGLVGWRARLPGHALQPIQQFAYTAGKNATDSALIIDAMDLLYSGNVDVFCIVSSDSDFTRLAMRLRESGKTVYGIGAKKTPISFQHACDRFTYTEVLSGGSLPTEARSEQPIQEDLAVPSLTSILTPAVRATAREDGWAQLSAVGSLVVNQHPSLRLPQLRIPQAWLVGAGADVPRSQGRCFRQWNEPGLGPTTQRPKTGQEGETVLSGAANA